MDRESGEYSGIGGKSAGCKSFGGGGTTGSSETNLYGETENWRVEIHPEPRWDRSREDRPNDRAAEAKHENKSTEHKKHEQETRSQSFGSQMGPKPHLNAANNVPVKDVGKNRGMQREKKKNKKNKRK